MTSQAFVRPRRADAPRAPDHGHPLQARPGDGQRGAGRPAWQPRTTRPFAPNCACSKRKGTSPTKSRASATSTCPPTRGALPGSRRCATSSTRFSTGQRSRSSRPCSAAKAPGCLTKSSIASRSSSKRRRKKEADEDVLDCLRRARDVRSSCAAGRRRCGIGCSRQAWRARQLCRFSTAVVPAWPLPFATPTAFSRVRAIRNGVSASGPLAARLQRLRSAAGGGRIAAPTTGARTGSVTAARCGIWLAGAAVGLSILLIGLLRLTWLATHARRITHGRWHDLADEISRSYGLRGQ